MDLPATGDARIDAGHDRLVQLLEKLRYNPGNSAAVFEEIGLCFQEHFLEEEGLMRGAGYRRTKTHTTEHRALADLVTRQLPGEMEAAQGYADLLSAVDRARQAFLDHVLGLDRELAVFLLRKERRAAGAAKAGAKGRKPRPRKPIAAPV